MILELRNIEKSFGEKKVLTGVSFKAEGGKAFGLLGRNGAGKTTSIRILMDVFPANSGEVRMDGKPIDYRKVGIGYLPEERGLYPKKTIIDQLAYFAELKGMSHKAAVKSVDYWLEQRLVLASSLRRSTVPVFCGMVLRPSLVRSSKRLGARNKTSLGDILEKVEV